MERIDVLEDLADVYDALWKAENQEQFEQIVAVQLNRVEQTVEPTNSSTPKFCASI